VSQRVLIVEDEQIVAADMAAKLIRMGHEVIATAASGEEAVALAERSRPEAVLMDVQLQGAMSGIEAAKIIQGRTGAPIIFVTAFAGTFLRNPGKMQAPGICLSKPFSMRDLQTALESVSRQHPAVE
jgi:CheY-like chemotaxis protein